MPPVYSQLSRRAASHPGYFLAKKPLWLPVLGVVALRVRFCHGIVAVFLEGAVSVMTAVHACQKRREPAPFPTEGSGLPARKE